MGRSSKLIGSWIYMRHCRQQQTAPQSPQSWTPLQYKEIKQWQTSYSQNCYCILEQTNEKSPPSNPNTPRRPPRRRRERLCYITSNRHPAVKRSIYPFIFDANSSSLRRVDPVRIWRSKSTLAKDSVDAIYRTQPVILKRGSIQLTSSRWMWAMAQLPTMMLSILQGLKTGSLWKTVTMATTNASTLIRTVTTNVRAFQSKPL
jgi:hypothetical protein